MREFWNTKSEAFCYCWDFILLFLTPGHFLIGVYTHTHAQKMLQIVEEIIIKI